MRWVRSGVAWLALALAALAGLAAAGTAAAAPPFALEFAGPGTPAPGALGAVGGDVAVDSEGNVWVEDATENRVVKYDYNGTFIAEFVQPEGLAAPFSDLNGLGADDSRGVYVVDGGTRVVKTDLGGRHVRTYGEGGPNPLTTASDVAVGRDGVVYVLEAGRIARFRQDGAALADITLPAALADGRDLAVSPSGDLYVNSISRIVRLSPAGAERDGVAVFASGEGLAVDDSQAAPRVYGKTALEGVIQEYRENLTPIGDLSSREAGPAHVSTPTGIDVDCRGTVYVVDRAPAGSRVVKFDDPATPPPPCAPPPPLSGTLDTQVNDIDVTQGVQTERDYTATDGDGPRSRAFGVIPGIPAPLEVPMRAGGKTVVRVYANLRSGPPGGIANIPLTLTGATSGGRRLGTIQPDAVPPLLRPGDARVDPAERVDRSSAYTFTLPDNWTGYGRLDLTARVNPAGIGCDEACQRRSTFVLSRIPFQLTTATCSIARVACVDNPYGVTVWPVSLRVNGRDPVRDPKGAFELARAITPVELVVWGWMGQIEVGDIALATSVRREECFLGIELGILCDDETETLTPGTPRTREVLQGMLFERIERFKADRNIDSSTVVMGLTRNLRPVLPGGNIELPGANRGKLGEGARGDVSQGSRGYADVTGPITLVAHELQHGLGRRHAGQAPACYPDPKQLGEPWPDPGNTGAQFGFGLDTRPRSGGAIGPYRLLASGSRFDLMSYCGAESNSWISTIGWNQVIAYRAPGRAVPNSLPSTAREMQAPGRLVRVTATESADGSLTISGTRPDRGAPPAPNPAAPYQLEARDAAGAILASAPMDVDAVDEGPTLLGGAVAAPPATAQVVVRRGTAAATRRLRSATAPTVRLLQPRAGARVAGRRMTVAWRSADRDGDRLVATVELSLDGGRSYRTLHVGPSSGRIAVPTILLGGSRAARLRIRVDDGFNEAEATSGRFAVVASPPAARVISPVRGQRVRAGAPLRLEAEATRAGGRPLGPSAFRWQDGKRRLGRGATLTVTGLRPGRHTIRLVASDAGRTTTIAVPIRVTAVRPAFLRLDAPQRLSRRARVARLRVASTVDATLLVAGRRFQVGPAPRRVAVPVKRGAARLRLTLRLRAGRLTTRVPLTIERS